MGLTNQSIGTMLPIARAWLQPPDLKLTAANFESNGYSRDDRANHLRRVDPLSADVEFNLQASDKSPAVNPALVIDGWGSGGASLILMASRWWKAEIFAPATLNGSTVPLSYFGSEHS